MLRKLTLLLGFIIFTTTLWAQSAKVTGSIKDEQGEPLLGAIIQNSTQKIFAQSNLEGKFTISGKVGETIIVTFTGFESKTIKLENLSPLNIILVTSRNILDEVIVSGYGIQTTKRDYTGASSKIDNSSLVNTAPTNISEVLQGRAAGVNVVSNDGTPGSGFSINIRGTSSITAGGQPLFVIDNIPLITSSDNDANILASLNPKDIESIDILKDASATALYGVGASNGVVVITTKKGAVGKPKINFNTKVGTGRVNADLGILSPSEYALFRANSARNSVLNNLNEVRNPGSPSIWEILANPEDSRQYLGGRDPYEVLTTDYGVSNFTGTNWLDLIIQNNFKQFYDFSVSGATKEGTSYFASFGAAMEDGSLIESSFKRYSTRLNLDQKLGKLFKAGVRLQYTNSVFDGLIGDWSAQNAIAQATFLNPFINRDNLLGSAQPIITNGGFGVPQESPEYKLQNTFSNRNGNNFNANLTLSANPLKWLEINFTGGITSDKTERRQYIPSVLLAGRNSNGRAIINNNGVSQLVLQPRISINKWFNKDNIFNASFIFETRRSLNNQLNINYTQFLNEILGINSIASAQTIQSSPFYSRKSSVSYIGNAQYNYKSRYIVRASARIDQSSIFLTNRTGVFPALSFAWNMADEKFMDFSKQYLSLLKFRVGYGITGNDQIRNNSGIPLAAISSQFYAFNDAVASIVNPDANFANRDITWETTYGTNLGMDFGFLNDRITFSANYYQNRTKGLLISLQLPSYSSFTNTVRNIGTLQNTGFEFETFANNVNTKNFSWTTNFNIAFNRNKVLDLGGSPELGFRRIGTGGAINDVLIRVGQPLGIYYGVIQNGVVNNRNEFLNLPFKTNDNQPGELTFYDVDGDGVISIAEYAPIGYTAPIHTGGIGNTLKYKNFDLYAFFRWSYGNDIINENLKFASYFRGDINVRKDIVNSFWSRNFENNNYQARNSLSTARIGTLFNRSEFVEDGSFLRFETLRFGYTLPKKLASKIGTTNVNLNLTAQNLFVLSRYSWYDPEVNTATGPNSALFPGLDSGAYPRSRFFLFGIDINL